MRFSMAFAAACMGVIAMGTTPSVANDASGAKSVPATPAISFSTEAGYVTTQGRGRGIRGPGRGPVFIAPRRRNNTGRNVAIGLGAAVLGAAILSQGARAQGGGNSCRRWDYQCANGSGYACRQLNRYC